MTYVTNSRFHVQSNAAISLREHVIAGTDDDDAATVLRDTVVGSIVDVPLNVVPALCQVVTYHAYDRPILHADKPGDVL